MAAAAASAAFLAASPAASLAASTAAVAAPLAASAAPLAASAAPVAAAAAPVAAEAAAVAAPAATSLAASTTAAAGAATAAGTATGAGAATGAAISSFLPQATRAAAAMTADRTSDLFMRGTQIELKKVENNFRKLSVRSTGNTLPETVSPQRPKQSDSRSFAQPSIIARTGDFQGKPLVKSRFQGLQAGQVWESSHATAQVWRFHRHQIQTLRAVWKPTHSPHCTLSQQSCPTGTIQPTDSRRKNMRFTQNTAARAATAFGTSPVCLGCPAQNSQGLHWAAPVSQAAPFQDFWEWPLFPIE